MSSESNDQVTQDDSVHIDIPVPAREEKLLVAIQSGIGSQPGVRSAARGLSHFGEHSLGWLAISGAGWALARRRGDARSQRRWIEAGVGAFGAHAASVIIKRVVRRPRPNHPAIEIGVSTPSKLSFPSSHATSTTAAAILIGRAAGLDAKTLPALLVPPMLLSRLVLGVHYPSDVTAGAAIGAASAAAVIVGDKVLLEPTRNRTEHGRARRAAHVLARFGLTAAVPGGPLRYVAAPAVARVTRHRESA
ncbi:phosphatase PAP2 family protein [Gordonia sp. zg691]|uniref:Phosphatase PAP2 family protein n=1 Tax=Gordonia jinghuaiqii TaxID=2758710 RepID=A0A7D7LUF6_9ACTN|nr:phosphatase PAP2 family protein [Gordonia jinghuaiqii]MBD0863022.1 phosphatase PAP2 family protein [Gordonia jinghuaiqii]MCR5978850.1 phosphatase PAP2 family protein [Gordonia jinghuaiqii]QMT01801.1 phosphatase PAP2 family protein [Gordonia jinghuaiqii]